MKQSHSHDIYLGILMNATKSNKEALEAVIKRIKDGWKMEVMSQAACTCVIKYVHGFKNRTGPIGSTGWIVNRVVIRSDSS